MSNSTRDRAIQYLTALNRRRGASRFQMFLFTTIATFAGVLASAMFHAAGMNSMAMRYPCSIGVAYFTFILVLSFFVLSHRSSRRPSIVNSADYHRLDFSETPPQLPISSGSSSSGSVSTNSNSGGGAQFGGVDGDGFVFLLILVAIVSGILANLYVVYQAPVIFAEILVDGVLLLRLTRRTRVPEHDHWTAIAMRRTVWPLISATACYFAVGLSFEKLRPGATTMYEAVQMTSQRQ